MIDELKSKNSEELVSESIKIAKETNVEINSFVTIIDNPEHVNNEESPLNGIPYAAKDLFSTKDILTTGSSNILANYVPFYDATVIAHLIINLQYVKQKKSRFSGTYSPSCSHIGATAAGLVSCPVLRSAAILFKPPARSGHAATKKASTSNGSRAPSENERLCSFCIQKRPDLTNQH